MKKLLLIAGLLIGFNFYGQVRLVSDIKPGSGSSNPILKGIFNGKLFYSANYSSFFYNYYLSDGITSKGFYSLIDGSLEKPFIGPVDVPYIVLNNQITMFNGYSVSVPNFSYLSKCDGATLSLGFAYTNTVYQETNFLGQSNAVQLGDAVIINGNILFAPKVTTTFGAGGDELLIANSTTGASILKDIYAGGNVSSPRGMTVLGTNVFFSANDGTSGRELWKTDGTATGTVLYLDMNTGAPASNPDQIDVLGTQLTFVATHPTLGRELFRTNGAGSLNVLRDINTSGDSNPSNVTKIGSTLYFAANNGTIGNELWISNGTSLGTILLKDINPSGDSNPSNFTLVGSDVYFTADNGVNGVELWKTDGTNAGTIMVKDINLTDSSTPANLTEYNGKLYFSALNGNGVNAPWLWVSNGTSTGTVRINAIGVIGFGLITPTSFKVFNNELYFSGTVSSSDVNNNFGQELYAYKDPTLANNEFKLNENAITLFPNPSKNYFELLGDVTIEKVEVYSMLGQLVKTFEPQYQYAISDLTKGNYIVKINTTESESSKILMVE